MRTDQPFSPHDPVNTSKVRTARILALISLIGSILALPIYGFLTGIMIDVYMLGIPVGCGWLGDEEICRRSMSLGPDTYNAISVAAMLLLFLVNMLEIISAVRIRKLKISGLRLYIFANALVIPVIILRAILAPEQVILPLLMLAGGTVCALVFARGLKKEE